MKDGSRRSLVSVLCEVMDLWTRAHILSGAQACVLGFIVFREYTLCNVIALGEIDWW